MSCCNSCFKSCCTTCMQIVRLEPWLQYEDELEEDEINHKLVQEKRIDLTGVGCCKRSYGLSCCISLKIVLGISVMVGYFILCLLAFKKVDYPVFTMVSKVKGIGYAKNGTSMKLHDNEIIILADNQTIIYDVADYVEPPTETSSIFVMTNFVQTIQSRGVCDEDYKSVDCICNSTADCQLDRVKTNEWDGIPTGKCIKSSINESISVCEVSSWCPVERDPDNYTLNMIEGVKDFTIYIRNSVLFEQFNKIRYNTKLSRDSKFIANCAYSQNRDPYCPVFLIRDILNKAEPDLDEQYMMLQKGGIIKIEINWNCDFFRSNEDDCKFEYKFKRVDAAYRLKSPLSGFNFRFDEKYGENEKLKRMLLKAFGLRFIIVSTGQATGFDIWHLVSTLGSYLTTLGIVLFVLNTIFAIVWNKCTNCRNN